MAREVRRFDVVIPAGTAIAAPLVTDLDMPPRVVERVTVRVPKGPSGLVGFALTMAGNNVVPHDSGTWIVADNEVLDWPLYGMPDSGAWQLTAYNTGVYDHTIYVTFLLDLVGEADTMAPFAPVNITP
jgi:hypothetical protein